jgi:hypothetical protein
MGMIGRADKYGVDPIGHPVEHLSEILKARKIGIFLQSL